VLADTVALQGHHLAGTNRTVVLESQRLKVRREIAALAGDEDGEVKFEVPDEPAAIPAGEYRVSVLVLRPGDSERRETLSLPLRIVPVIDTTLPMNVPRDAQGNASVSLDFRPEVRPEQRAVLLLGTREIGSAAHTTPTGNLTFDIVNAPPGSHLVRLRIDGVESQIVDTLNLPPRFFNRRIVIT
jgi:hypothetical protein